MMIFRSLAEFLYRSQSTPQHGSETTAPVEAKATRPTLNQTANWLMHRLLLKNQRKIFEAETGSRALEPSAEVESQPPVDRAPVSQNRPQRRLKFWPVPSGFKELPALWLRYLTDSR